MSEIIEVYATRTETVEVVSGALTETFEVVTGTVGPPGRQGDTGPVGPSAGGYIHTQPVPATVWAITHDLGYDPAGLLVVADGYVMDGFGVQVLTPGVSLRLSFDISLAGLAYLS